MNQRVKTILKLLLTGLVTTMVRIAGQLSIPAGEQTVLPPSLFAQNGTMPLAFTVYGFSHIQASPRCSCSSAAGWEAAASPRGSNTDFPAASSGSYISWNHFPM